jgi:hypothetical protein
MKLAIAYTQYYYIILFITFPEKRCKTIPLKLVRFPNSGGVQGKNEGFVAGNFPWILSVHDYSFSRSMRDCR